MSGRKRVTKFLQGQPLTDGTPAAFFQHFIADRRYGDMALKEHVRFWKNTRADIMKVMFDHIYPKIEYITSADQWSHIPRFTQKDPIFMNQVELTKRLVDEVGGEAYILHTLFAPFVSAGNATTPIMEWDSMVTRHLKEDPLALGKAMGTIAEVLSEFAHSLTATGVDGFYVSVQAGEQTRFTKEYFEEYLKPYDILLLQALMETGKTVFVHLCGENLRFESYYDYPGNAFNMSFSGNDLTIAQAMKRFGRPIMGGLDNHGVIVDGTKEQIYSISQKVLEENPAGLMLGADCTIPSYVPEEHLRWAIEAAHAYKSNPESICK